MSAAVAKTEVKFTPGPWTVGAEVKSEPRLVYISIFAGKKRLSSTGVYGRKQDGETAGRKYTDKFGTERHEPIVPEDEARANARLIAAAPDLFAALGALTALDDGDESFAWKHSSLFENARAALAKALGESI
jgi:hypothetical protein